MKECRIVILNYNGRNLLEKCLPGIVQAAGSARHPTRVAIIDNQSTDDGLDYVRKEFPSVDIWVSPENRYLCSYNDYLKLIPEPVAILLNNDIRVDGNFIDPLADIFDRDPQAFLAAPKVLTFDGTAIEAASSRSGVRLGMFWCNARYPGYEYDADQPSETFSSGFGAFCREKFLSLEGYDDRYLPGILEDVDICYRAKQAGYRLCYEPRSIVYHMGQATFKKKFGSHGIAVLAHRNTFLFMWKNFKTAEFRIQHLFFLPGRLFYALLTGQLSFVQGLFQALGKQWKKL